MTDTNVPNLANSLLWIHQVITRGLGVCAQNSESFASHGFPDASLKTGFLDYTRSLASVLGGHHLTEDDLAFPYLRTVLPDAPYTDLAADHHAMEPLLVQIETAVAAAAAEEDVSHPLRDLHAAVVSVGEIWHPHIMKEEQSFSAEVLEQLISPEEHIRLIRTMGEFSQQHTGPGPLVIPFLLYNLPEPERTAMAQGMPAVLTQELVPGPWRAQWSPMEPFLLK
jgi:hemerythrin-like domain-containing protein